MMEKVIRDGMVAVLYSPGHGAGWYSWAITQDGVEAVLFDPEVVAWVEGGKVGPVPDMEAKYGFEHFYDGGADDLMIEWIPVGTKFRIREYDGYESAILIHEDKWITA